MSSHHVYINFTLYLTFYDYNINFLIPHIYYIFLFSPMSLYICCPFLQACVYPSCTLAINVDFAFSLYTSPSAPGFLFANANINTVEITGGDTYLSTDAGFTWSQVLPHSSEVLMLDSGGVMAAVPYLSHFQTTSTIRLGYL